MNSPDMTQGIMRSSDEVSSLGLRLRERALQECARRNLSKIQGWLLIFVLLSVWGGLLSGMIGLRLLETVPFENTQWYGACLLTYGGLSFFLVTAILRRNPNLVTMANLIIPVRTALFLWTAHDLLNLRPEQGIFTLLGALVLAYQTLWLLYFNRSRRVRAVARKSGLSER